MKNLSTRVAESGVENLGADLDDELAIEDTYLVKYAFKKHFTCTQSRVASILEDTFDCTLFPDLEDQENNTGSLSTDASQKPEREFFTVFLRPLGKREKSQEKIAENLSKAKTFVRNNYHEGPFYERKFTFPSDSLICYCLNGLIWRYCLDITLESEASVYIRSASNRECPEEGKKAYEECRQCLVTFLLMEREKRNHYDGIAKNGFLDVDMDRLSEVALKYMPSRRHLAYNHILESVGIEPRFFVPGLRHVILDVSNIAMVHGQEKFSWAGVKIAYDHFRELGHDQLTLIVPHFRRHKATNPQDLGIIEEFERQNVLKYTQSRIPQSSTHDDRFMLQLAHKVGAVIVSNDKFSDLARENPAWKELTRDFVCTFIFVKDVFLLALDPQGREGDRLPRVLRRFDPAEFCCGTAAMYCKFGELCNYGKKCRYLHRTVKETRRMKSKRNSNHSSNSSLYSYGDDDLSARLRRDNTFLQPSLNLEQFMPLNTVPFNNAASVRNNFVVPQGAVVNSYPLEHNSDFSDGSSMGGSVRQSGSMLSILSTNSFSSGSNVSYQGSQHGDNISLQSAFSGNSFVLAPTIYESPYDDVSYQGSSDTSSIYSSVMDPYENNNSDTASVNSANTAGSVYNFAANNVIAAAQSQNQASYSPQNVPAVMSQFITGTGRVQTVPVIAQAPVPVVLNAQMETLSLNNSSVPSNSKSSRNNVKAISDNFATCPQGISSAAEAAREPSCGSDTGPSVSRPECENEKATCSGTSESQSGCKQIPSMSVPLFDCEAKKTEAASAMPTGELPPVAPTAVCKSLDIRFENSEFFHKVAENLACVAQIFPLSICLLVNQQSPAAIVDKQQFCVNVCNVYEKSGIQSDDFWAVQLDEQNQSIMHVVRLLKQSGYPLASILMIFPEIFVQPNTTPTTSASEQDEDKAVVPQKLTATVIRERIRPFVTF